ncbi:MAG: hypothetical protein QOF84_5577 [Streptomyces sp.]|nr:hypothetical protein [Streptomyces sp.]
MLALAPAGASAVASATVPPPICAAGVDMQMVVFSKGRR